MLEILKNTVQQVSGTWSYFSFRLGLCLFPFLSILCNLKPVFFVAAT